MNPAETPQPAPRETPASARSDLPGTRCVATKANGEQCRNLAQDASGRCFWHGIRERVAAAGRKGATSSHRHRTVLVDASSQEPLSDPAQIRRLLAGTFAAVQRGTITPAVANSLCRLLQTSMQLISLADVHRRLQALEEAGGEPKVKR